MPNRNFSEMFPEIQDSDLVVSQSTISSLELSPCRWYYRAGKVDPSEPMFFGTVEHAIIEAYITGHINHWELISPQNAAEIAYLEAGGDDIDLDEKMPHKDRRAAWFLALAEAAEAWYHQWWVPKGQDLGVLEAEKPYAMRLREPEMDGPVVMSPAVWFVTGGIDLVVAGPELYDWKTAGRGWQNGQGTAIGQKEAYAMLYEAATTYLPEKMTFVVYNRDKGLWKEHEANVTRDSVAAYRARVDGWVRYMLDPFHLCTPTDGKRRGWWSKPNYNDVWDLCPSCRNLGDEFDKQERVIPAW